MHSRLSSCFIIDIYKKRINTFKKLSDVGYIDSKSMYMLIPIKFMQFMVAILSPLILKFYIDNTLGKHEYKSLTFVIGCVLIVFVLESIIEVISSILMNRIRNRYIYKTKLKYWDVLISGTLNNYKGYNSGEIKTTLCDDIESSSSILIEQIIDFSISHLMLIGTITTLIMISWQMSAITILILLISKVFESLISKSIYSINDKIRSLKSSINSWLIETCTYKKDIRMLSIEDLKYDEFENLTRSKIDLEYKRVWKQYLPNYILIGNINNLFVSRILIYAICGLFILNNQISVGFAFAIIKYFSMMMTNLNQINQKNLAFSQDIVSIERLLNLSRNLHQSVSNSDVTYEIGKSGEQLTFDNNMINLNGQSVSIKRGESLAIIDNDFGYEITSSILLMNGKNYIVNGEHWSNVCLKSYYRDIGVSMNCYQIFDRTIKENLLISNSRATDKEIQNACRMANIDKIIESMPMKYDTILSENGASLSGGQKQLLAIARMLLKQATIFILVDAFSAVDVRSQQIVIKNILALKDKKIIYVGKEVNGVNGFDTIIRESS